MKILAILALAVGCGPAQEKPVIWEHGYKTSGVLFEDYKHLCGSVEGVQMITGFDDETYWVAYVRIDAHGQTEGAS